MDGLYKNEEEALRHSITVESLAKSLGVRSDDVRSLYETVLAEMKRDAVIMDFLPVLAARQVREILRRGDEADWKDYL